MNKSAIAGLALLLLSSSSAVAQQAPHEPGDGPAWTVQIDPLTAALGYAHVQVERRLADSLSIYAGPHLRLYDSPITGGDEDYIGLGGEVGVRWFFRGGAPAGWWAQIRGVLAHLDDDTQTDLGGYASALAGYTWIFGDRWVLAGGLGVQYIDYTVGEYGTEGVIPAAHTTLGVAF